MASIARIWDHVFRVFLEHLEAHPGFDDPKVMVVNVARFCGSSRFHQMAGGTPTGSPGLRGIVVFGMDPDGPRISKALVFCVARKTEGVVVIGFGQLGPAGPSMGVMAIKT